MNIQGFVNFLHTDKVRDSFLAVSGYLVLSVFFLFGLLMSRGDVAQQDWAVPITSDAAVNYASSFFHVWVRTGFGGHYVGRWGFPFFPLINGVLAPLGFVGGIELKLLAVFLVSLGGVTTYALARSFRLGLLSSFLAGLFFMTTAVVFDWLVFGWMFYLLAYNLLPLMILVVKKYLETSDSRYLIIGGLILSLSTIQPTFILVFPLFSLIFIIFESRGCLHIIRRGVVFIVACLSVWFLTTLTFFTAPNHAGITSFYQGEFFLPTFTQFENFSILINPIRLWGSTFNFQFETYFPVELVFFSFLPILLGISFSLLKLNNRYVLFSLLCYLSSFLPYFIYSNFHYLVFNLPYGHIFEAPSIFLAPASLGLAILIGFSNSTLSKLVGLRVNFSKYFVKIASFMIIFVLLIVAGAPWWMGAASGPAASGIPTKLNLYEVPSEYIDWSRDIAASTDYFVFYIPPSLSHPQIIDSPGFSLPFEGVNGVIFTQVNDLPYVWPTNASMFLDQLFEGDTQVAEYWGNQSIKYIVVYTNVEAPYDTAEILNRLSAQQGMEKVKEYPNVVVYQNSFAQPIVYTNSTNTLIDIIYHDPTSYKINATSSDPFYIIFNQAYSSGWVASINGAKILDHTDINGFNCWYVNYTGNVPIEIYYEPQTVYVISFALSLITIITLSIYVVIVSLNKLRNRPTPKLNNALKPA
ncbi:hypothetical protein [Candidatus Bathycorpusculum sp.]|uniref:hypothetical protein n=1 Tax=Candidatus Bathycorpusculum sp. TaxID=2994959 RepID=UPI002816D8CC|nr:hypothetical protein [Candidatus Termitimicrobium sp.]MCL2430969.1 hypothetical protein [Candidatus Termitimicrobium sp.]